MARTLDRPRRLRRACFRLRRRGRGSDDGFILLESMIAITLITVIMGAIGMEFVGGLVTTGHQRAAAAAARLADTAVDAVRALDPSDLLTGRDCQSVTRELDKLKGFPRVSAVLDSVNAVLDSVNQPCQSVNQPGQLAYDASATYLAFDASATYPAGASAGVPTAAVTQPAAGTLPAFTVYEYLECAQLAVDGACLSAGSTVRYLRLAAAVVWTERGCPSSGCSYVTVSLINANSDPTFKTTQSLTPAPVIVQPDDQTVVVGDSVSLQLAVQSGTGAPPLRWSLSPGSANTPASANLPAGLTLSTSGLISGTVQGSASGPTAVTVQVSDSVSRPPATATFSWAVKDRLKFVPVPPQAAITTEKVSITVSATGGIGPYTFSDPNNTLPPGLTLSGASITGTPSEPGDYTVTLTVVDSSGIRKATATFPWTVKALPMAVSNPGPQVSTVDTPIAPLHLQVSGGDGTYEWSSAGLPAGLTLSSTGTITDTPTATAGPVTVTVTVADPSANIDPQEVRFTWTIYAAPQITTPSDQNTPIGGSVNIAVGATCPDAPCTYGAVNLPSGVSVDANTGQISGTVAANASSTTHASVTMTDRAGATATTADFTWNILPTVDVTSAYLTAVGAAPSVQVTYICPNNPCTITLAGSRVPGIGLSADVDTGAANTTTSLPDLSGTAGTVYLTGIVAGSSTVSSSTSSVAATSSSVPSSSAPSSSIPSSSAPSSSVANSSAPSSMGGATTNAYTTAPSGTLGPTAPSSAFASSTAASSTVAPSTPAPTPASSTSASSTNPTYAMTVTITDRLGYTSSKQTTWTVRSEPAAGWPGDVSAVGGNAVAQAFSYTCQTTCTLSVDNAPKGVGLAAAESTAHKSATSATVSGNGTYYLTGKVTTSAPTGARTITLTMTESTTSTTNPVVISSVGVWTVS